MSKFSTRKNQPKKKFHQRRGFILTIGIIIGIVFVATLYQTSVYFSTNESCMICHVHPHAEESWMLSVHVNNSSGVMVNCVDCHLPPTDNTWAHYSSKVALAARDVWGYITKDSADFDWDRKSELDYAVTYIPNESCVKCHQNLFPQGITDDGITSHLYYEDNVEALDLQCISCHLDAGHYNPDYVSGQMVGVPAFSQSEDIDSSMFYHEAATLTTFANYTEYIPETTVSFNMIAVNGGTFMMGSPEKEPFRNPDESPQHQVELSPFYMAESETTWNMYWAFYVSTMSEGRTPPDVIYFNNQNAVDVDGISGPTPPWGYPDQGWGHGDMPAITMTHYAAETFCQWLSAKTGKTYRLPTEAEWEYAARGGTESAYFFPGSPKDYSEHGFMKNIFKPKTEIISDYVVYDKNSDRRTKSPVEVLPNPLGLKNMLGNVFEYTSDKYNPDAYNNRTGVTRDPVVTVGDEWVVRGGNYTSDAADVRSAARGHTNHTEWLKTDPQQPKSIWWYSDIKGIGFRVVCEP